MKLEEMLSELEALGDHGPGRGDHMQLTIIHRGGYEYGPGEGGRWIIGFRTLRDDDWQWSGPFGQVSGPTLENVVRRFHVQTDPRSILRRLHKSEAS